MGPIHVVAIVGAVLVAALSMYAITRRKRSTGVDEQGDKLNYQTTPFEEGTKNDWGQSWFCDQYKIDAGLKVTYTEPDQRSITRTVTVLSIEQTDFGGVLMCICHSPTVRRNLRIDQIRCCVNLENEEKITNVWEYLFELYRASPAYLSDLLRDVVDILSYLVSPNGSYSRADQQSIVTHVRHLIPNKDVTPEMILAALPRNRSRVRVSPIDMSPAVPGGWFIQDHPCERAVNSLMKNHRVDKSQLKECCFEIRASHHSADIRVEEVLELISYTMDAEWRET